jgi:hypothetical protein
VRVALRQRLPALQIPLVITTVLQLQTWCSVRWCLLQHPCRLVGLCWFVWSILCWFVHPS